MSERSDRRAFLTGRALRDAAVENRTELAVQEPPSRGQHLALRTQAMACDFDVMLNLDGPSHQVSAASHALDEVHLAETQYSVYRPDSELSCLNRLGTDRSIPVEPGLYRLLARGRDLSTATDGAFDHLVDPLIQLWRRCRAEDRIPAPDELALTKSHCGPAVVAWDDDAREIRWQVAEAGFNLGAIGKGHAVDLAAGHLQTAGVADWLIHGGRSSVRVQGSHAGHDGWPVALHHPQFPDKPFCTLLLKDAAMGTSGTAVQWFRHAGVRYGHILDPRNGMPVEGMLSVSVIAPDAAQADALSTAFFVLGVENALRYCDTDRSVGAILFPMTEAGRLENVIFWNIPRERVFLADAAVEVKFLTPPV